MFMIAILMVYWPYYLAGILCYIISDLYKLAVALQEEKQAKSESNSLIVK